MPTQSDVTKRGFSISICSLSRTSSAAFRTKTPSGEYPSRSGMKGTHRSEVGDSLDKEFPPPFGWDHRVSCLVEFIFLIFCQDDLGIGRSHIEACLGLDRLSTRHRPRGRVSRGSMENSRRRGGGGSRRFGQRQSVRVWDDGEERKGFDFFSVESEA